MALGGGVILEGGRSAAARATAALRETAAATRHPLIVTGATLGGPVSAFQSKYGIAPYTIWDINGLGISADVDTGVDGQPHVIDMLVYMSDAMTTTQAQAAPVCRVFLPPDAHLTRDRHDTQGNFEELYTSLSLAATFPPTATLGYDPLGIAAIDYQHDPNPAVTGIFLCRLSTAIV
jgi:hypothetical protein